jgi:glucokinase
VSRLVPAIEVGGTHFSVALIDVDARHLVRSSRRDSPLDANADAHVLLDQIALSVNAIDAPLDEVLSIAVPGPFDYGRGIGRYQGIGKFESLEGVDVGAELRARLTHPERPMVFLNDAEAFLLGESSSGAVAGHERAVALTIGTGIGSAFLVHGSIVRSGPGVPLDGAVHNLSFHGAPLEEVVSRRCIRDAYLSLRPGTESFDVLDIAIVARNGDDEARSVFDSIFTTLGEAIATCVSEFAATVLVVGGGISRSWDLVAPPLHEGLMSGGANVTLDVKPAAHLDESALVGAALFATSADRFGSSGRIPAIEG